ncbi:UvrD-helicase domain-containing protein [Sphingobacterium sp.]|uniref:UvrD-helicase domain-containing protein n=1 Tax=Sphingobacterium sp. TaxID=341027 RepID=UPI0028A1EA63|nr:UvrD-helicase domain-containing protein [Sphingobacterium sp.]
MARKTKSKATLIIAGPGAGKTHNMVAEIIYNLTLLDSCRFMAVITHTNAATNNIKVRLSKLITIPQNLFIGTIHAFLNKFIVIPYSSFGDATIPSEKLFVQFGIDKAMDHIRKQKNIKTSDHKGLSVLRGQIVKSLNKKGYITFDQTLVLARNSINNNHIAQQVANRLQFLFVDEFQDTGNEVYNIIETLRKLSRTKIYCVGDPEQYIQSFDSTIRSFTNIPILKALVSTGYEITLNQNNFRCSEKIVTFLNQFNGRIFGGSRFQQFPKSKKSQPAVAEDFHLPDVFFIKGDGSTVSQTIAKFYKLCDDHNIPVGNRCLLGKQETLVKRIIAAVNNRYMNPKKNGNLNPINTIRDTVLYMLETNSEEYYLKYKSSAHELRKQAIALFHAIRLNQIANENDFGNYLLEKYGLQAKRKMLIKIEDLKFGISTHKSGIDVTVANIHTIKGLEHEAVLVIAKDEEELLSWLQTDRNKRDQDKNDTCRIGYVAFSRAEKLLCISCLKPVSTNTLAMINKLGLAHC